MTTQPFSISQLKCHVGTISLAKCHHIYFVSTQILNVALVLTELPLDLWTQKMCTLKKLKSIA